MSQNYQNHVRFSPPFHFFTVPFTLIGIALSIYMLIKQTDLTHTLIALAFILIGFTLIFARFYALKAQDRAARADERLRYYILSGKMLPSVLKMSQILALRFASDEEFVALVDITIKENLSSKNIKLAIKDWRGDYHRI